MIRSVDTTSDDRWCTGIALHDFAIETVKWQEWFDYNLAIFTKHGLEPTRLSMNGRPYGHSVKTLTFKGGYKKLLKYQFDGLESISFMTMPDKDDYTSNFIIYAAIRINLKEPKTSYLSIVIDEKLQPFVQEQIEQITLSLQQFTGAKYGYHYRRHLRNQPDIYCVGGAGYYIDEDDEAKCRKWSDAFSYAYPSGTYIGPYNTGNIRDIYKLNFLSTEHLAWQITEQYNLKSWILSEPKHGELKEISSGFWLWSVDEEIIPSIRQALLPSGIIPNPLKDYYLSLK